MIQTNPGLDESKLLGAELGAPHAIGTLPETNSSPLKIDHPKRKLVFQPSIFRGYVSFREGNRFWNMEEPLYCVRSNPPIAAGWEKERLIARSLLSRGAGNGPRSVNMQPRHKVVEGL